MTSDDRGGFNAPQEIAVEGEITALASEKIDFTQAYAGIVVAVSNGESSSLLVYSGKAELVKTSPHSIAVEQPVDSMILARSDFADPSVDLFGLADGRIFTVYGIGNTKGKVNPIDLPFRAVDFAVGEFISDRRGKTEMAVLSENGTVSYLTHGTLDTRPFTNAEIVEFNRLAGGRGNSSIIKPEADNAAMDWTETETHQLGVYAAIGDNSVKMLRKAYLTGNETEDLMVVNSQTNRVQVLFREPNDSKNRTSFTDKTKVQNVDFSASPAAVLPMRLNVMGQQGFVFFGAGSLEPSSVIVAPNANFAVTKTEDTNDGTCGADCSLREAVVAANAAVGADSISFNVNGTFQLTIGGASENASATGDLDVTQALTVVGNGTANTIITAGTNTTNGIDKIFSVNPLFNAAFASSFTGITMRFGRNPSLITGDGFGGGLDWEGSGVGTISISNTIVDQNTATDGRGGGLALTNSNSGAATITSSTISNNNAERTSGVQGVGGGIFVGTNCPFSLNTVIVNNNNAISPSSDGGGINMFGHSGSTTTFTAVTITNNDAAVDGGGISTARSLTINPPVIISNNTSGRYGGGLSMLSANTTVTISKATMIGNSAVTDGGALAVGANTPNQIMNVSFSRIAGNTGGGFTGLVTRGGTANVESNWWGCNTGPSAAPCDTAGAITGGVIDFDPWLQLRLTASPNTTPVVGDSRALTASFLLNSAGGAVAASNLDALIGVPVVWSASGGTISGSQATIQANGQATATFTATMASPPARTATAQVDSGPATVNFTVGKASTTTSIGTDTPDPSLVGQSVTVTYSVAVTAPGGGTPGGNVTVSDGVNSCSGTVAAGQCNVALATAGARTLTATYEGDTNYNASPASPGVAHTVTNTATWTGGTSTDWNNNANWNTMLKPGTTNHADIPAGMLPNEPTIGAFAVSVANLTVGSGRTLTVNGGGSLTSSGTATINGGFGGSGGVFSFNNLTIGNASGVTLGGNATVNGVLALTSGDLNMSGANTLTQPAAGSSTGTFDVNGRVQRTGFVSGGAALSFGNPFNSIQVTSGPAPANIVMELVRSVPTGMQGYPTAVQRTYTITPSATGFTGTLRLHYLPSELNGNNPTLLNLWRYDATPAPASWRQNTATSRDCAAGCTTNTSAYWVEKTGVSTFSPWTLNSTNAPTAGNGVVTGRIVDPMARRWKARWCG